MFVSMPQPEMTLAAFTSPPGADSVPRSARHSAVNAAGSVSAAVNR